jgi:hypothetical protein
VKSNTAAGLKAIAACRRCGAWARSAGRPCRAVVVKGRPRCYWHGSGGRGAGPPKGSQNGLIHGRRSRAAMEERKEKTAAGKLARQAVAEAKDAADAAIASTAGPRPRRARKAPTDGGT